METLSKAPGVGPALAREIHGFFHPDEEERQDVPTDEPGSRIA